jgi:Fe-S-cluster containining protein
MSTDNPCLECSVNQGCCSHLNGLRVNQDEFDRCFAHHVDKLDIDRDGPLYRITVKDGGACPNWEDKCSIYEDRPMECALFPHTIGAVFDDETLLLTVHKRTECPLKDALAMDDADAIRRVERYARETLDIGDNFRVILDEGPARLEVLTRRALRKIFPN